MQASQYQEIRTSLASDGLLAPSDLAGFATLFVEILISAALIFGVAEAPDWWKAPFDILCGIALFRWFVILHECGHRTLFRSKRLNIAAGLLASTFCLIPYFAWRNVHFQHHRWAGVVDKDPTQSDLLAFDRAPGRAIALRIVWFLWLPGLFLRFIVKSFWFYAFDEYRAGHIGNARLGLISDLVALAPQWLLIAWLGPLRWAEYAVPIYAIYLFVIENMSLPQHSELAPFLSQTHPGTIPHFEQDTVTRSTFLPDWLSVLFLNFNRHAEHHMFPAAPWYALNRLRQKLTQAGYRHPFEVPFFVFMLRLRRRDPVSVYRDSLPGQVSR